ncbi:MAG: iron-containing redox enzyme family protein [Burkholderiales bacterium]|jgi:3-oxoacyl-[acyl-carrier-protein] synthase-3
MQTLVIPYEHVYLTSSGSFLPGEPVSNEAMDDYIGLLNAQSSRLRKRILAENGIQQRYYAIARDGATRYSCSHMAAQAVLEALSRATLGLNTLDYLACATVGGDLAAPGFANQVHGALRATPLNTLSVSGICASSVQALRACAHEVELAAQNGKPLCAIACASEIPSRLFKKSRFEAIAHNVDFDSHFLRWMLSDGAGAVLLQNKAHPIARSLCSSSSNRANHGLALQLKWIHIKSFSGDYPTCMKIGEAASVGGMIPSYLDYPTLTEAEAQGAFLLRQDIRLLPNLFDLGIAEFSSLVRSGWVDPSAVDHFLCHYSSERFSGLIQSLLEKSGLSIDRSKWYSNLTTRGNTGSASIFIMLDEFLQTRPLKRGEKILCFVPESGRFTVAYALLEVVGAAQACVEKAQAVEFSPITLAEDVPAPLPEWALTDTKKHAAGSLALLLQELNAIWHDYRSRVFRAPLVQRIFANRFSLVNYQQWMAQWIPQVREGSFWMRSAIEHLPEQLEGVRELISQHAKEEQFDFKILYDDYVKAGGTLQLEQLKRNPGGEALNAYMQALAGSAYSYALLGGIFIIEGTGQRIIPALLPRLKNNLGVGIGAYRFLQYHGENDIHHLERWMNAVEIVLPLQPEAAQRIIDTARHVAQLYSLQWEYVLPERDFQG